jgi:hypothetical protein
MVHCDRCNGRFALDGQWIQLRHNHPHMEFESRFCSSDCAVEYLEDSLTARR